MIKGIKDDQPYTHKAVVYDNFIDNGTYMSMGEVEKTLDVGRNKLFRFLRYANILDKNNIPYQQYIDRGYFTVKIKPGEHIDKNFSVTLVSPKGLEYIDGIYPHDGTMGE
jgi:phage antirepressor YoqD-like protein